MKIVELCFLAVFCCAYLSCQKTPPQLQSGDLIFQNLDGCNLCDRIESVTKAQFNVRGINLSHVAILSVEGDGVFVYEAWDKVRKRTLQEFLAKDEYQVVSQVVKRPTRLSPQTWRRIKDQLDERLGLPYDDAFLVDNNAYYCSELVVDAFNEGFGEKYFSYLPMYYGRQDSEDYVAWHEYFKGKNLSMPVGPPGASPLGLFLSEKLVETKVALPKN